MQLGLYEPLLLNIITLNSSRNVCLTPKVGFQYFNISAVSSRLEKSNFILMSSARKMTHVRLQLIIQSSHTVTINTCYNQRLSCSHFIWNRPQENREDKNLICQVKNRCITFLNTTSNSNGPSHCCGTK